MGRVREGTKERHIPCFFSFLLVATLYSLLVQPVQAKPVDSVSVEGEHQATTQTKTETKEITIYIGGEYKTVAAALLDAVDEETPITGVADFDSLSSTYGLIGISSGFYGYRFRLTFPPAADVASIAGAYWTLPYINSVESEPVVTLISKEAKKEAQKRSQDDVGTGKRIANKLIAGTFVSGVGALAGGVIGIGLVGLGLSVEDCSACHDEGPGACDFCGAFDFMAGVWGGYIAGATVGVSAVDPQDDFRITLAGSTLLGAGVPIAIAFINVNNENTSEALKIISGLSVLFGPVVGATIASERWRKPLSAKRHLKPEARRVSIGLVPNPKGGLSAVTTLRF